MKILITSGGTTEKIDEVRSISNFSTGMLGKTIADEFSSFETTEQIFYICGLSAVLPETPKVKVKRIGSVAELEAEMKRVLVNEHIDAVIHCMAVSDYSVDRVTTSDLIEKNVCSCLADKGLSEVLDEKTHDIIKSAVLCADALPNGSKISSDVEDLVLILRKTPKIIAQIRKLAPETVLTGFKLLNGVSYDSLIDTGYGVLEKNGCDFVLANDLTEINGESHIGYLIDKDKKVERMTSKKEIAEKIVSSVIKLIDSRDKG